MRHTLPLKDHPEFSLHESPGWREYRVNKQRPRRDSDGLKRYLRWYWFDACIPLFVAVLWSKIAGRPLVLAGLVLAVALYAYIQCMQVVWESVIVLPSLGIQLETHRGPFSIPIFASRRFIPLSSLEDFIINEGLRLWNVRYYLVAVQRSQHDVLSLEVAFENLLPRFPVLLEVYHGVHETLQGPKQDLTTKET